jgi:WD40 repeat protein
MSVRPDSPYKGLNAFEDSELDALLFFGREREREIVTANLVASRLTVLYGPSGVGKSSLLRAAVARSLRALPEEPLVVVFSSWSDDPAAALAGDVVSLCNGSGPPSARGLLEVLEDAQDGRDVYLVLDQAEEYFLYHADDAGPGSFAEALPALLSQPLRLNVLVSLREDSLAKLDRFTGRVPGIFANTLRLDRLDRQAATAAIVRPVERYAELTGETTDVEPALVARVLDDVGAGLIRPALGGEGAVETGHDGVRIEAPFLQLVMQRLWEEERAVGSTTLRVETLDRLGGAQQIVEDHLAGAMERLTEPQKDIASRLFNHLVTPSGTKISHEISDLADFGDVSADEVTPVLASLADRRILRSLEEGGATRYEIFHDVLAQPVLAWRARHRTKREIERQLAVARQHRRRLQLLVGLVLVALALMSAVTIFALSQRSDARAQARQAQAHELEAVATTQLSSDPELSLLLALQAVRLAPTETAEETLRTALFDSRVRTVVHVGEPVQGATVRGKNVVAVTADGDVVTADSGTGDTTSTIHTGVGLGDVSFAANGAAALTGVDRRVRIVDPAGAVTEIRGTRGANGADLSADGSLALVLRDDEVELVEVATGAVRQVFAHPGAVSAAISPHGALVVTGGADATVRLWHVRNGKLFRMLPGQEGHAVAVAFSPLGDLVASASTDGLGRVWAVGLGVPVTVLSGHGNNLTDIGFSTDGTQIVTASKDRTARVYKSETGSQLVVLAGHTSDVRSAAFTGGAGSTVVTASIDGTARIWDALVQPELREVAQIGPPVTYVDYLPGDRIRAVTSRGPTILDAATGASVDIGSLPPAPSGRTVVGPHGATATIQGDTVVARSGGRTTVLRGHEKPVTSVSFSADGSLLVTASRDHDVRIWDARTGHTLHVLQGHFNEVNDARFSPDGRWVVSAGPASAGLWDAHSGTLVTYLRGHAGPVLSAAFDPSSRVIVTGGADGTVRTYRCEFCGPLPELVSLAGQRLAHTGRSPTDAERKRFGLG